MLPHHQKNHGRNDAEHALLGVHGAKLAAVYAALQDVAQQARARLHHFALVKLGNVWKVLGFAQHQFDNAAGGCVAHVVPP